MGLEISLSRPYLCDPVCTLGNPHHHYREEGVAGVLGGQNVSVALEPCPDPEATVPHSS